MGHHAKTTVQLGCDYSSGLLSICRQRGFEAIRCDCLKLPFKDNIVDGCICIAVIHHLSTHERRRSAIKEISRVLKPSFEPSLGGRSKALIYAWAKEQQKDCIPSSYLKQRRGCHNSSGTTNSISTNLTTISKPELENEAARFPLHLPVHKNRTNFEHSDLLVPWKTTPAVVENRIEENSGMGAVGQDEVETKNSSQTFHRFYHVFEEGELERLILSVPCLHIERSYYDQGNWCVVFSKLKQ